MRIADDFLLVSPSKEVAEAVSHACVHELPKHGISVSTDKMSCNVPLQALDGEGVGEAKLDGKSCGGEENGEKYGGIDREDRKVLKEKVAWCGLLIDSAALSVEVCFHSTPLAIFPTLQPCLFRLINMCMCCVLDSLLNS